MTQQTARTRQDLINSGEAFAGAKQPAAGATNSPVNFSNQHLEDEGNVPSSKSFKRNGKKQLSEFCYSVSNLVLIIASVVALCVLIRFIQDDPLYEYGEYLLSLEFMRELTYAVAILPFVLLLPIFNALSSLLLSDQVNQSASLTRIKLAYQVILFLLVLLALIFFAPYIRASNLSSELELQFKKHMQYRYDKTFSYNMLESIQETYHCCDELWYRANLNDQLPISCFKSRTSLVEIHDDTCENAIAAIVSLRCSLAAACFILILVALACLFAIDLSNLLANALSSQYKISNAQSVHHEQLHQRAGSFQWRANRDAPDDEYQGQGDLLNQRWPRPREEPPPPPALNQRQRTSPMIGGQDDPISELLRKDENNSAASLNSNRISAANDDQECQHQQVPLLSGDLGRQKLTTFATRYKSRTNTPARADSHEDQFPESSPIEFVDNEDLSEPEENDIQPQRRLSGGRSNTREPVVLARANLRLVQRDRSQSPIFKSMERDESIDQKLAPATSAKLPIKSALKKTPSNQHIAPPASPESGTLDFRRGSRDADADSLNEYADKLRQSNSLLRQKSLMREQPTRRSLLSVRFAE